MLLLTQVDQMLLLTKVDWMLPVDSGGPGVTGWLGWTRRNQFMVEVGMALRHDQLMCHSSSDGKNMPDLDTPQ